MIEELPIDDTEVCPVLTRMGQGKAHRSDVIKINWAGITDADLRFLAGQAILMDTQCKITKGHYKGHEGPIEIDAKSQVHREILSRQKYEVPDSWLTGEDIPEGKWVPVDKAATQSKQPTLEEMLAALTPAEILALLK